MERIRELHVAGHKLAARAFNPHTPGPPIFLLHGLLASIDFWIPDLRQPFEKRGPCTALSLPGHYPAAFPPGFPPAGFSAATIAGVLTVALDHLTDAEPAILVGHSTGGFAALAVAAHAPAMVRGVVCISGFARGRRADRSGNHWLVRHPPAYRAIAHGLYRCARRWPVLYRAGWRLFAADARRLQAYPHFATLVQESRAAFRRLDVEAVLAYLKLFATVDIGSRLQRITAPTLAVTGDRDPVVPPDQARTIAAGVVRGELAVVENTGHLPFFENPARFKALVDAWLDRHAPTLCAADTTVSPSTAAGSAGPTNGKESTPP